MTSLGSIPTFGNTTAQQTASAASNELVSADQFMQLLVAQLENQNPFEPQEGTEFVAQLAQFANLEQMTQMNEGLDYIALGQVGLLSQQTVMMLGKDVTYAGNSVSLDADGTTIMYNLNASATDMQLTVYDDAGVAMGTAQHAPRNAGMNTFEWDGTVRDAEGNVVQLEPGDYTYAINASDGESSIVSTTYSTGRVSGVTYDNDYAQLMVGGKRILPEDVIRVTE